MAVKVLTAADLPNVAPQRTPSITVPDTGSEIAGEVGKFAEAGNDIALQFRAKEEDAEAQDALNKFSEYRRGIWLGDDTDPGYSTLSQKDAADKRGDYETRLEARRKEIEDGAGSERVRRSIRNQLNAQKNATMGQFGAHYNTEMQAYETATREGAVVEARQDAVAGALDPVARATAVSDTRAVARAAAVSQFGDPASVSDPKEARELRELINSHVEREVSATHSAIVNELLQQPEGAKLAKEYLGIHGGDIDADTRSELKTAVREGSLLGVGQEEADKAARQFDLSSSTGVADALAAVRKKYAGKPEQLKAAEDAVSARVREEATLSSLADEEHRASAITKLDADGMAVLTPGELNAMLKTTGGQRYIEKKRQGEDIETDWEVYNQLIEMRPKDLVEEPLLQHRGNLSDGDFRVINNLKRGYRDARESARADAAEITETFTPSQQLAAAVNELGFTGAKKAEVRGLFYRKVQGLWAEARREKGSDLMSEERQSILDRSMREEVLYKERGFDKSKLADLLDEDDLLKMANDARLPAGEHGAFAAAYEKMVRTLRKDGYAVNRNNILLLWGNRK